MLRGRRLLASTLAVSFALAACDSGDPTTLPTRTPIASVAPRDKVRVIGLVGTMSGRDAWRGDDAYHGAEVGVVALNQVARGRPFQLVTRDDAGDPERAAALVDELARDKRTVGIVYAGPPEGLRDAEAVLARSGIPAFLCYGDFYSLQALTPHVFQVSPPYLWQARRIVRYLLRDRRYDRIGALTSATLTGEAARRSLGRALGEYGASIRTSLTFDDTRSAKRALRRLRSADVQAVVVEGSPVQVAETVRALRRMGAAYRTTATARAGPQAPWRPQIATFDTGVSSAVGAVARPGTVAADSYARGAHYLPIPSLRSFAGAYESWWQSVLQQPEPLGWERRSYEAVRMLGWGVQSSGRRDVARALERLRDERFGGLDITLGPDDHTSVGATTVGLWVVPRKGLPVTERGRLPSDLPWVPLARGFSIDGERTDVLPEDWRWLFRDAPPKKAPAPRFFKARFGVTTKRSDPIH